ncbi:MAG: lipid II flippase MurJ [Ancalomicrobiaceae bacterium]|nr:lipid II flippase MurJ [Ancalomicrobiaceae bacterium]
MTHAADPTCSEPTGSQPAGSGPTLATTPAAGSGRRLAILLMIGAIFSKCLGLLREILMARVFGASIVADGFRAATTGVMIPLAPFQNESVPAVLIPLHHRWQTEGRAPRLFAALALALTGLAALLAALVLSFAALWVDLLVGGFSPEAKAKTQVFLTIMALAMPASVLINVLAAGEISLGRSRLTTIRASLLNIAVISGIVVTMFSHWPDAIAWAFAAAFNMLALWGLATLVREGALDFTGLRPADVAAALIAFGRQILPLTFVPLADQGNVWIERLLASRYVVGTVASLDYARTITDSAVLFISQPIGLVLLSRSSGRNDAEKIQAIMRVLFAVGVPGCAALALFAPDVARIVFARGAFNETAVQLTADAIRGIAVGLWASTIGWVALRILNGAGRNALAAGILIAAYLGNLICNVAMFNLAPSSLSGPLILGLGEAVRGLVLLTATATAIGVARPVIGMALRAALPAIGMIICGTYILEFTHSPWLRLAVAGIAAASWIAVALGLLAPDVLTVGLAQCRKTLDRRLHRR